jgi:hypothetical protein
LKPAAPEKVVPARLKIQDTLTIITLVLTLIQTIAAVIK